MSWTHHVRRWITALSSALLLVVPTLAHGQAVTAAWDPSPPADQVTGYQVCVGTSSLSCNVALAPVSASTTTYPFTPAGGTFYYVAARATNAAGASPYSSEVRFSIPSFAQPGNQSSVAGSAIAGVNLSISDPDGSPLTITHTGLPVGLTINAAQRRIAGTPSAAGTHNVTVFVNDGLVTVSRSFTWTVAAPVIDTLAPSLTITSHPFGLSVHAANVTISGAATDSGRGGNGITSVRVNGAAALGGSAAGSNSAYWSQIIALSVGSNSISVETTDGAGNITLQQINVTRSTQVCTNRGDLNGDCKADLLWHNSATGQIQAWFLNGSGSVGSASLPTVADTNWEPVAVADINRDGASDLIWRNRVSGYNQVWYLNGTTVVGAANLPTVADTNWQLVASADFNKDGFSDLIWRNRVRGYSQVWYLNGTTIVGAANLPTVADTNWELVASADFNNDGYSDLIWRNRVRGYNQVWYLNGTTIVGAANLRTVTDTGWRLAAALDIDNDGATELIWRQEMTGYSQVWYLNQSIVIGAASLPTVSAGNWRMIGVR